jgi:hypothetical protein
LSAAAAPSAALLLDCLLTALAAPLSCLERLLLLALALLLPGNAGALLGGASPPAGAAAAAAAAAGALLPRACDDGRLSTAITCGCRLPRLYTPALHTWRSDDSSGVQVSTGDVPQLHELLCAAVRAYHNTPARLSLIQLTKVSEHAVGAKGKQQDDTQQAG